MDLLLRGGAALLCAALIARADLATLATLDAASAHEGPVLAYIRKQAGGSQEIDNTGSLAVTYGSGRPHTLLIAGMDEPGYVVSAITDDGYLRVQRLANPPPQQDFEDFFLAKPVRVTTASGKGINGVVAALSVHLQSERGSTVRVDHPEEFYVDVGARSRDEVQAAGIDLLDPITLEKAVTPLGSEGRVSAPWISGRAGAAVLLDLAKRMAASPPKSRVTLAFVSQQYSGNRGLARTAERLDADRIVWLRPGGRARPAVAPGTDGKSTVADELLALARRRNFDCDRETAERVAVPAFAKEEIWKDPAKAATLTLGVENAGTPVEVISLTALAQIADLLADFAGIAGKGAGFEIAPVEPPVPRSTLEKLIAVYGVSGAEQPVRKAIEDLLPDWARRASRVDPRGNLIVALGEMPERLFIAHMDELGFEVTDVESDGKLRAETRGGAISELFEWSAAMLQAGPKLVPAILLGGGFGRTQQADLGARSEDQAVAGGVKLGDRIAHRKRFRPALGRRVNARSADDRVGCAVMVDALRSLKRDQIRRSMWFVFSVEEETGLKGAEFVAESVRPKEVYAIDTFVSSDSPLENQRMGGARLGGGFVIRAIDSSGITPRAAVARVAALARKQGIPVQYGVTSGANDGSKFVIGGAVNIPLGWPLRYSHSPAEMIDLGDVEALEKIVRVLATE